MEEALDALKDVEELYHSPYHKHEHDHDGKDMPHPGRAGYAAHGSGAV